MRSPASPSPSAPWRPPAPGDAYGAKAVVAPGAIAYTVERARTQLYEVSLRGSAPRPIRRNDAVEYDPSWSFDGRRLAWIRVRGGRGEVWVMRGNGTGQHRIAAGLDAQNPSWSPDGKRIVFWDARSDVVYTVGSGGGRPQRLTNGFLPDWSPSGKTIAFARQIDGDRHDHALGREDEGRDAAARPRSGRG